MTYNNTTTPNNLYAQNAGNSSSDPFITEFRTRDPNTGDVNFPIQKRWFNTSSGDEWMLLSFIISSEVKTANWVRISGESAQVEFLTGDTGGTVSSDVNNNINLRGTSGQIAVTGNPGTNTLTFSLANGGTPIDSINVDASTPPGTDPVVPDSNGLLTMTGAQVSAGTVGTNVIRSNSLSANSLTYEIQRAAAVSSSNVINNGVAHFNSATSSVDANGFMSPFQYAKWVVNPVAGLGTHTTITAANAAASSGDIIFVYQGTYTENFTAKPGVTITAWDDANGNGNVTIKGKVTYSSAGITAFSCINFETNGDFAFVGTQSALNYIFFSNCSFVGTNHTILNWINNTATPSNVFFYNCSWDLQTTGIAYFEIDAGSMGSSTECSFFDNFLSNTGGSTTASTTASGAASFYNCVVSAPITSSGGGGIIAQYSYFLSTVTCINAAGSGSTYFNGCSFGSGTATAIVCDGVVPLYNCDISSTNTNVISGSGTVAYAGIVFADGGSQTISTTTQRSPNGGTFVPVLAFGGASVGITYAVQAGSYLRVDNVCHFYVDIELSSKGSSVGAATITGLPFASRNAHETDIPITIISLTAPATTTYFYGDIAAATSSIALISGQAATGGFVALADTNFANDTIVRIQGSYFI